MKKQIIIIASIRPDYIRLAPLIKKLEKEEWVDLKIISSGQHYDYNLFKVFLKDLNLPKPDYNLELGQKYKTHHELSGMLGSELIKLFEKEKLKPDTIIFLGDSNGVLASIPLKKEGYNITHIEAGMRSGDIRMAEEINRICCDHVSDFLFVYHENYMKKLIKEGISPTKIHIVGNTIVEAFELMAPKLKQQKIKEKYIVVDIHRPENFKYKDRMEKIIKLCDRLGRFSFKIKFLRFGRTMEWLSKHNIDIENISIEIIDLMGYEEYLQLQMGAEYIISDSGTASEECVLIGVPCIVPRDFTERPEAYEYGSAMPINLFDKPLYPGENIKNPLGRCVLDDITDYINNYVPDSSWLGDGQTSSRIIEILKEKL